MRRRICAGSLVCLLGALLNPSTRAQSDVVGTVRTESGLHRASFRVPQGAINVNLPDDLGAGDTISGTVYTQPTGKNPKELASHTGEITGYVIELPGQKANAKDRRFRWAVPATVAQSVVPILLRDRGNKVVGRAEIPVNTGTAEPRPPDITLPLGAQAGAPISVWGPFSEPSAASVTIGGQPAEVLAESPRKLVALTPSEVKGKSTIEVRTGTVTASGPFSTIGLQTGITQPSLLAGQTAVLTATVTDLKDLDGPATLTIVNHDTTTVSVSGGPVQRIVIEPAAVSPGGTFTVTRTVTGVRGGNFDITIAASRSIASHLPIDRIAQHAVDGWSAAQRVAVSPEARSLIVSGVRAALPQLDSLLGSQLAYRADVGSELDWLVRDYCFDLRDRKLSLALSVPPRRPRFANGFVPQASTNQVSIEAGDVQRFSFTQFIAKLLARLTPSDPFGNVTVTSQPDRQPIAIDENAAAGYLTTRTLVLSVGRHVIRVASCNQTVNVNANQKTMIRCPQ